MRAIILLGVIAWLFLLPIVERKGIRTIDVVRSEVVKRTYFPFTRELIHAVVKQESGYNHRAVSSAGAAGLLQLMPATGREWHRKLGIKEPYNPFNSRQNILIGTHYLKHLVELYDGDLELALTAYNQGPGRVDKLLKKHKTKRLKDIINDLGPDGRGYARNVLSIASRMSG